MGVGVRDVLFVAISDGRPARRAEVQRDDRGNVSGWPRFSP
jgi:hypothetical protein